MLEARTQENKSFPIFFMKETDCAMKIMASWVTVDELEVEKQEETSHRSVVQSRRRYLPTDIHSDYILSIYIK